MSMAASTASDTLSAHLINSLSKNPQAIGTVWIISSSIFTTYSTTKFLKYKYKQKDFDFYPYTKTSQRISSRFLSSPRPALLTFYRFSGSLLLGLLLHPNFQVLDRIKATLGALPDFALPALFLFTANYANSISLNRIGISLTYTTKCCIPIITVFLTLLLDGVKTLPGIPALLSLIPIAVGVAAASWNSPTFESIGFGMAMLSCLAQTALNVTSKRAMHQTGIGGLEAQRAMVAVSFVVTTVLFISQRMRQVTTPEKLDRPPPLWLSSMAVVSYHVEYLLSFMFVKLVTPVSYGACDAVRRLSIIVSGNYMFGGDRFSRLNLLGIAMAVLGALSYAVNNSS